MSHTADVVIVGAGIIGGSIAFHLLERDPRLRIVMLEKEAEPGTGATSKATGGVRFQFSTEANVRLTQLSYRYFTHSEEILGSPVDFLRHGYLFVTTDAATLTQCRRNVALQRGLGVPSELLTPGAIQDISIAWSRATWWAAASARTTAPPTRTRCCGPSWPARAAGACDC